MMHRARVTQESGAQMTRRGKRVQYKKDGDEYVTMYRARIIQERRRRVRYKV